MGFDGELLAGSSVLFFGNVPPPYGGLSAHLEFFLPRLVALGVTPVVLLRQEHDYSHWRAAGVFVYQMPNATDEQEREATAFRERASPQILNWCEEVRERLAPVIEEERFWSDIGFAERIARMHAVSLVHTYHAYHRSAVALALRGAWPTPDVLTIFGEIVSDMGHREELRAPMRWMLEHFERVLATSVHCASGVELLGMKRDRVTVIPYGVDTAFYRRVDGSSLAQRYGIGGRRVILFQGRVSGEKGPQVLVDALPDVFRAVPESVAFFVGPDEGPNFEGATGMAERLAIRVQALDIQDHVTFTGAVPFEDLPAYYSLADVLVFPSTTAKECMGLSMKQAMACGTPVVAARAGGAPEAIEDGVTGFLCEPNNPLSLAQAIINVLTSPNRDAMGKAAYERALALYGQERTLRETTAVYRDVLTAPVPGGGREI